MDSTHAHPQNTPDRDALRERIAEEIHAASVMCERGDPVACSGECRGLADAVLAVRDEELETLRHKLAVHDNVAERAVRSAEEQIRRLDTRAEAAGRKLVAIREAAEGWRERTAAIYAPEAAEHIRRILDDHREGAG